LNGNWIPAILRKTEPAKSDISRKMPEGAAPGQTPPMAYGVPGVVRWLSGLFSLTEEDRLAAGIHIGNERRTQPTLVEGTLQKERI
jgi:hypothetical protein